jgi:hypothetical protein
MNGAGGPLSSSGGAISLENVFRIESFFRLRLVANWRGIAREGKRYAAANTRKNRIDQPIEGRYGQRIPTMGNISDRQLRE